MFSDNRKINLNLEPKPAVVPERYVIPNQKTTKIKFKIYEFFQKFIRWKKEGS
ncbi:hypothetical protein FLAVO9R_30474 [Flavobacterium sp. 9R]|nr:hypothetical protein FLAVO9R_30474 [Flavobacterium sp. 9R]